MKGKRKQYRVTLIVDGELVIREGTTDNCKHALRDAYAWLDGIPSAECNVRADGDQFCYFRSNWKGVIVEIEMSGRKYRTPGTRYDTVPTISLNPHATIWPARKEEARP